MACHFSALENLKWPGGILSNLVKPSRRIPPLANRTPNLPRPRLQKREPEILDY